MAKQPVPRREIPGRVCAPDRVPKSRWSSRRDSNPRPPPWESGALPSELLLHIGRSGQADPPRRVAVIKNRNSVRWSPAYQIIFFISITTVLSALRLPWFLCPVCARGTHTPVEPVTGLEPASPAWEAGILTSGRYRHPLVKAITDRPPPSSSRPSARSSPPGPGHPRSQAGAR